MAETGYRLTVKKKAEAEMACVPAQLRTRILEKISSLAQDPRPMGVKKLGGAPLYRLRSGPYRILYDIDDRARTVDVLAVRHRREAYRDLGSL